jgi:hypothetical protein
VAEKGSLPRVNPRSAAGGYAPAGVWHMAQIPECGVAAVAVRTLKLRLANSIAALYPGSAAAIPISPAFIRTKPPLRAIRE